MKNQALIFTTALLLLGVSACGSKIRPRAGMAVPVRGGDISYTFGVGLAQNWTDYLSTELSYDRYMATGKARDANLFQGEVVLGFPSDFLTPYISGGAGLILFEDPSQWRSVFPIGAGVTLSFIPVVSIGIGGRYQIIADGPDYFSAGISAGLSF